RPVYRAGGEPAVIDMEVVSAALLFSQDQRPGIDNPLELRVRDSPQHGLAVDRHEDRRGVADENLRRSILDRDASGLAGARRGQRRLEAIERDRLGYALELLLQLTQIRRAVVRKRRKVALGQVDILKGHLPCDAVHLSACRAPNDTEDLIIRATRFGSNRGAEAELIPLPAFNLWLIHGQHGIAELDLARPRVKVRWCRCGRWRCLCERFRCWGNRCWCWGVRFRRPLGTA